MTDSMPIGPWERLLAADQRRDNGQVVGWMVALDRELDPGLAASALEAVRPAFPLYFARI